MFYMSLSTHFAWSKDERIYAAIVILGLSFGRKQRLEWGHFPQKVELNSFHPSASSLSQQTAEQSITGSSS